MALSLLQIVMVILHLPGIYISEFSPQLSFFVQLSVPLSSIIDKYYNFFGYSVHFETVYYPILWDHIICHFVVSPRHCKIFSSRFALLEKEQCIVDLLFLFLQKTLTANSLSSNAKTVVANGFTPTSTHLTPTTRLATGNISIPSLLSE